MSMSICTHMQMQNMDMGMEMVPMHSMHTCTHAHMYMHMSHVHVHAPVVHGHGHAHAMDMHMHMSMYVDISISMSMCMGMCRDMCTCMHMWACGMCTRTRLSGAAVRSRTLEATGHTVRTRTLPCPPGASVVCGRVAMCACHGIYTIVSIHCKWPLRAISRDGGRLDGEPYHTVST